MGWVVEGTGIKMFIYCQNKRFVVKPQMSFSFSDYPDKESCAVVVYFCGCLHHCKGCQNLELQRFSSEWSPTSSELIKIIASECRKAHTKKVVFSGGDCVYQNTMLLNYVIDKLKSMHDIDVCIYTGFEIKKIISLGITGAAFYKCGLFDETKRDSILQGKTDTELRFATKNQKLYNSKYKLVSVDNVYYFRKRDRIIAKFKKAFSFLFRFRKVNKDAQIKEMPKK